MIDSPVLQSHHLSGPFVATLERNLPLQHIGRVFAPPTHVRCELLGDRISTADKQNWYRGVAHDVLGVAS